MTGPYPYVTQPLTLNPNSSKLRFLFKADLSATCCQRECRLKLTYIGIYIYIYRFSLEAFSAVALWGLLRLSCFFPKGSRRVLEEFRV